MESIEGRLLTIGWELKKILAEIKENNKDGKQMDFVSHPRLVNNWDNVMRTAQNIEDILYQK